MNNDFDDEDFKTLELEHFLFNLNNNKITNMYYLHGNCHLFALLYSEITGAEIGCLVSESEHYSEFEKSYFNELYLDHAFCFHPTDNNLIIDAKGIRYLSQVEAEYTSGFNEEILRNSQGENLIKSWIKEKKLNDFETNEKELLKQYILNFFIPNNYDKTPEEMQSQKISEFLNKKIAQNIVQEIKKEFQNIDFDNPEQTRGQCSYFNILVMKKLNGLNIQSKSILSKNNNNFHNATLFSNIVIDMTASQFGIKKFVFEHKEYLKHFESVSHTLSKKLKI